MKIVFHFDLNRTIVMSDAIGGRSMENTINYLLSEVSWGKLNKNGDWECSAKNASVARSEDAISYKEHVDRLYPYTSLKQDRENAIVHNKKMKKQRTLLQSNFVKDGPGHCLQHEYEKIVHHLKLPTPVDTTSYVDSRFKSAWDNGCYYLLPSFINALFYLDEVNSKRKDVECCVVYRTFGDDIPQVAGEIDLLVQGTHPLYLGKKLSKAFALTEPYATFYRDDKNCYLAVGTLEKVPYKQQHVASYYQQLDPSIQVLKGHASIDAYIYNLLNATHTTAIRDYWEYWNAHGENENYGKLLFVNSKHGKSYFIDDHVEHQHAHIVDVRDATTGHSIPFDSSLNKSIFRAEPYLAITDPNYYIDFIKSNL